MKKLRIFDFDDTLAKTKTRIHVTRADGTTLTLSSKEYAGFTKLPGDVFDYSEFRQLVQPEEVKWMTNILKNVVKKYGRPGAIILTARGDAKPIREFFDIYEIPQIHVVALNSSDPKDKASFVERLAQTKKYDFIEFFDDSPKNVVAVGKVNVPGVTIRVRLIDSHHPSSHHSPST